MATVKRLSIFVFIFALIFVLAVPAFATWPPPTELDNTAWDFDQQITSPPFTYLSTYIGGDVSFTFGGFAELIFSDMYWDGSTLYYVREEGGNHVTAYSSGTGWRQSNMRQIGFTSAMTSTSGTQFANWLYSNAVQTYSSSLSYPVVTWNIEGQTFSFSDSVDTTPTIGLSVNSVGATLSLYTREFDWFYSGSREFTGLSLVNDNTPDFPIGYNGSLPSSSASSITLNLYPCYAEIPVYSTTIRVFSNDGVVERFVYSDSAQSRSPTLVAKVTDYGLDIISNGIVVDSFYVERPGVLPEDFTGFSLRRNAPNPTYAIDASVTAGGALQNSSLDLYMTFATDYSDPMGVDMTSWIMTAVGGFFAFELWPGLSLGDLVLTILAIGLLFSFLKLTI